MTGFSEADWEQIALETLAEQEWLPLNGTQIAPGTEDGRESWDDLVLPGRMLAALRDAQPARAGRVPASRRCAEIVAPTSQDAIAENYRLHQILVDGYRGISYIDSDGIEQNPTIRLVSHRPSRTTTSSRSTRSRSARRSVERRFDVVLYLNGMPVAIVELKKAGDEHADLAAAHAQLQTYLREFPMAFRFAVLVGHQRRHHRPVRHAVHPARTTSRRGTSTTTAGPSTLGHRRPTTSRRHRAGVPHRRPLQPGAVPAAAAQLHRVRRGRRRATPSGSPSRTSTSPSPRRSASTVAAVESNGKAGVVWHTQGSGKSMEMELYAHLVAAQPKLKNPTIVVITDRTELDGQLFETFNRSQLLPETPVKVTTRGELRDELTNRTTGGIYFTTLQKFGLHQGRAGGRRSTTRCCPTGATSS